MIRRLSPELIREIAAGEVISAPVDVVRELLENALDAGATRLKLELHYGGIERISLKDNGLGIPEEELPLALEAHSTSKLQRLEDVHAIYTLGFRGEGLYAIRHAANVTIASRPTSQLGGSILRARGDTISIETEQPLPAGTTVTVRNLFEYLPARRASLESSSNESKAIMQLMQRYLLHHPQISLEIWLDDTRKLLHRGGTKDALSDVIKQLWGVVTANRLLTIDYKDDYYQVKGMLSRPELSRPRRDRLHLAINGRPVAWHDNVLQQIQRSYAELLPSGHFPVGVLNLTMPADTVLVNTSPDKSQVRLLEPERLIRFLDAAIKDLFTQHPLSRSLPDFQQLDIVENAQGHTFPKLRYLGRYQELYLLAEGASKLWVIDQHAAHERIIFEELRQRYENEDPVHLEQAEIIHLNQSEAAQLLERQAALAQKGLVVEAFGTSSYAIRSVPALLIGFPKLVEDVLRSSLQKHNLEQAWRDILARLACLPAIKAGHALDSNDAQALLDTLCICETPWSCPHGRPTALVMSELELSRRFGRRAPRAVASSLHDTLQTLKPS